MHDALVTDAFQNAFNIAVLPKWQPFTQGLLVNALPVGIMVLTAIIDGLQHDGLFEANG